LIQVADQCADAPPRRSTRGPRAWTRLSDEKLLQVRLCDLGLSVDCPRLARPLRRLHAELDSRGLSFRPHVWLSEEWFSPDGVPGIAIPFYLTHPRLERLERSLMREAEGANARDLMRILRHEAGHAIDTAYRLRRRARWREAFGPASLPYPDRYRARPGSRRYVQHLGGWYAQSHPTEDFAETFAVWLKPNSDWRTSYADWPAYRKLVLVDELMGDLRQRSAPVRNRRHVESISTDTRTLAELYRNKLARRRRERRGMAEDLLRRVFVPSEGRRSARLASVADDPMFVPHGGRRRLRASTLLRSIGPQLVGVVSRQAGMERYSIQQIMRMLVERSDDLKLQVRGSRREATRNARWMVEWLAQNYAQGETPQILL
jgi:hypothetical protein